MPSRAEVGGAIAKQVAKSEMAREFAITNAAGAIAGSVGAAGGLPGTIAASVAGAAIARRGLNDYSAMVAAKRKLRRDEAYTRATRFEKLKLLREATIAEIQDPERKKAHQQSQAGDIVGAVIGSVTGVAPPIVGVPLGIVAGFAGSLQATRTAKKLQEGATIKEAAEDVIDTPGRLIREGNQREAAVRGAIETTTGRSIPSRSELIRTAGRKTREYIESDAGQDLIVNTAGFVGSKVGGAIAGKPGELAGDLGGALVVRSVLTVEEARKRASLKLSRSANYRIASRLSKVAQTVKMTAAELNDPDNKEKIIDNLTADVAGWAIGNAAAEGLSKVPGMAGIPLKGAAVAIKAVPAVASDIKRVRKGESVSKVIGERGSKIKEGTENAGKAIVESIKNSAVRRGNERERRVRQLATNRIRAIKGT